MTKSDINLTVYQDNNAVERIEWKADDSAEGGLKDANAMILALWDPKSRQSLRIDLWTKEMTIPDMNDFFYQTLLTMADTYEKATSNKGLMSDIKIFAREFADKASKFEERQQ